MSASPSSTVLAERIENRIFLLRGEKVMFDFHLAELYGVETKTLNRAVQRNLERFPDDFMFQIDRQEFTNLKYQIGTSSLGHGGVRKCPYAFTEQGVAMLASVLGSPSAVQVNIAIVRAFVHLRQLLSTHVELARKLATLERKYDEQFKVVFDAIRALMSDDVLPHGRQIGFLATGAAKPSKK
jgi:hypothetical protein